MQYYRLINQSKPLVDIFFVCKFLDSLEYLAHMIKVLLFNFIDLIFI